MGRKIVVLLTMLSMTANGFLPRSVLDVSHNSFLVDAIACQRVFLDFLHLSDKSLVAIAVKAVGDMSVAPLSSSDDQAVSTRIALARTTVQISELVTDSVSQAVRDSAPAAPSKKPGSQDNTTADHLLFNAAARAGVAVQLFVSHTRSAMYACAGAVTGRLSLWAGARVASLSIVWAPPGTSLPCRPPDATDILPAGMHETPFSMTTRFCAYLPRGAMEDAAMMRGI